MAISEMAYAAAAPGSVLGYRLSGFRARALGRITGLPSRRPVPVAPSNFHEFTLSLDTATLVFPNVVVAEGGQLLDSNTGYTSTELAQQSVPNFPVERVGDGFSVRVPGQVHEIPACAYLSVNWNYSAFLLGELPRVESYRPYLDRGLPLLVHGPSLPFHRELLALAGVPADQVIEVPVTTAVKCGTLTHATPTYLHSATSYAALDFLRTTLRPGGAPDGRGEMVYLSRSALGPDADRPIRNELELERRLEERGFRIVHPQDLTPAEQIAVFASADTLIAPFGAMWASALFRKPGSKSLMLSTKFTPEFARIFQYLGQHLHVLPLPGERIREGGTLSKSHAFSMGAEQFAALDDFLAMLPA